MKFKNIVLGVTISALLLYVMGLFFPMNIKREAIDGSFGFIELLLHNSKAEFFSIVMGAVTLGLYSVFYLFINFFTMGIITATLLADSTVSHVFSMFVVHGIFEIPAMILTIAFGIYIPWKVIGMIKSKAWNVVTIRYMAGIFSVIVLLTILAAAVESFVTPKLN